MTAGTDGTEKMRQGNRESVRIQREIQTGKGKRRLYADLVVGDPGLWALVRYELVVLFSSWVPGALGLLLRSRLYPLLLAGCGKNVVFGTGVVLRHPGKIRIGDNVVIDDNCLLDAKGRANRGIYIGDGVFVGRNSIFSCKNGDIILEDDVNIGFNCEIFSGSRVKIGDKTLVAAYCYFVGGDHDSDRTDTAVSDQGSFSCGIRVGRDCWFGAGTTILDGIKVGDRSIVGAGAVVTRDVDAGTVVAGVPARFLRRRPEPGQAPFQPSGG